MKSSATNDGTLLVELTADELARLRAYTRLVTGIEHPTADDIGELLLAARRAFSPQGCRHPRAGGKVRFAVL